MKIAGGSSTAIQVDIIKETKRVTMIAGPNELTLNTEAMK